MQAQGLLQVLLNLVDLFSKIRRDIYSQQIADMVRISKTSQ